MLGSKLDTSLDLPTQFWNFGQKYFDTMSRVLQGLAAADVTFLDVNNQPVEAAKILILLFSFDHIEIPPRIELQDHTFTAQNFVDLFLSVAKSELEIKERELRVQSISISLREATIYDACINIDILQQNLRTDYTPLYTKWANHCDREAEKTSKILLEDLNHQRALRSAIGYHRGPEVHDRLLIKSSP